MSKKWYILFLFCIVFPFRPRAQQMGFANISADLKLPALECYGVFQDKKGYIWISTEAGICRYDGTRLELIRDAKMSPNEAIYAMVQAADSILWMASSQNRILFYQNDSLYEAPFSQAYKNLINNPLSIPYKLGIAATGDLYINGKFKTVVVDKKDRKAKIVDKSHIHADYVFLKTETGLTPIDNDVSLVTDGHIKIVIIDGTEERKINIPFNRNFTPHWQTFMCKVGRIHFFSVENLLVRINEDFTYAVYSFSNRILSIYTDNADGLWVGTLKDGLCYYPDIGNMSQVSRNLDNYSVTGIYEDHEHGIWVTTLEKGVFYCKNKNITYYSNIPGLNMAVNLLKHEAGYTFAASEGNQLFILAPYSTGKHKISLPETYIFSDIIPYGQGWILASRQGMVGLGKDFNFNRFIVSKTQPFSGVVSRLKKTGSGELLGIYYSSYKQIDIGAQTTYRIAVVADLNIRCFLPLKNEMLLLGAYDGVYKVEKPFVSKPVKISGIDAPVTQMIFVDDDVWITSKDGLWVLKNDSLIKLNDLLQIPSSIFFDITQDKLGNIWVASNIGLVKINMGNNSYKTKLYTTSHGLISSEIYRVVTGNGHVYVSTSEGVCSFPLDGELSNFSLPSIYLGGIYVNGNPIDLKKNHLVFGHDENSIDIVLDVLTFRKSDVKLSYRLKNDGENWQKTSENNQISLVNLSPGNYELEILAINSDGVSGNHPVRLSFIIQKPFWQTLGFIIICIIVIALLLYTAFKYFLNRVRWKAQEQTRINQLIAESKLSALQAQMNPHFIFNAINSIQNYILKKNPQEAYDYLAKFSKLVRIVLNNSRKRVLTLGQELETIELYVELERLRFKNNFDFVLEIDDGVDIDETGVPAMLIQPYIENAIWHGLMQLENKNENVLRLAISIENERLKIMVEDNGIGRQKSSRLKKDDYHTPVATILTEQRLEIINRLQGFESTNVTVTDLYNPEGVACGTKVEIRIPFNNVF